MAKCFGCNKKLGLLKGYNSEGVSFCKECYSKKSSEKNFINHLKEFKEFFPFRLYLTVKIKNKNRLFLKNFVSIMQKTSEFDSIKKTFLKNNKSQLNKIEGSFKEETINLLNNSGDIIVRFNGKSNELHEITTIKINNKDIYSKKLLEKCKKFIGLPKIEPVLKKDFMDWDKKPKQNTNSVPMFAFHLEKSQKNLNKVAKNLLNEKHLNHLPLLDTTLWSLDEKMIDFCFEIKKYLEKMLPSELYEEIFISTNKIIIEKGNDRDFKEIFGSIGNFIEKYSLKIVFISEEELSPKRKVEEDFKRIRLDKDELTKIKKMIKEITRLKSEV